MAELEFSPGKYPTEAMVAGAADVELDRPQDEQALELARALEVLESEGPLPSPILSFLEPGASSTADSLVEKASEQVEGPNARGYAYRSHYTKRDA